MEPSASAMSDASSSLLARAFETSTGRSEPKIGGSIAH
jgi:hypothetical protein